MVVLLCATASVSKPGVVAAQRATLQKAEMKPLALATLAHIGEVPAAERPDTTLVLRTLAACGASRAEAEGFFSRGLHHGFPPALMDMVTEQDARDASGRFTTPSAIDYGSDRFPDPDLRRRTFFALMSRSRDDLERAVSAIGNVAGPRRKAFTYLDAARAMCGVATDRFLTKPAILAERRTAPDGTRFVIAQLGQLHPHYDCKMYGSRGGCGIREDRACQQHREFDPVVTLSAPLPAACVDRDGATKCNLTFSDLDPNALRARTSPSESAAYVRAPDPRATETFMTGADDAPVFSGTQGQPAPGGDLANLCWELQQSHLAQEGGARTQAFLVLECGAISALDWATTAIGNLLAGGTSYKKR